MPKRHLHLVSLPPEEVATPRAAKMDLSEFVSGPERGSVWTPRLTPILTLLQEVLADLFTVRDHVLQAQGRGGQPPRAFLRQYERDWQWLTSPGEQAPFSFGWLCEALGLEASAVRRRYLSGQAVSLPQHHRVGRLLDKASLTLGPRRARAGKARPPRSRPALLNGRGHEGNGTDPTSQ
jgi:hypothetical protein